MTLPRIPQLDGTVCIVAEEVVEPRETSDSQFLSPHAVPSRRRSFHAGRHAAHEALDRLGVTTETIPVGAAGEPRWPEGVVGSITHAGRWAGAAVAKTDRYWALGLDMETDRPFSGLNDQIATAREQTWLRDREPRTAISLFAAKETVFKALFPTVGRYFGFDAVEFEFGPEVLVGELRQTLSPLLTPGFEIEVHYEWFGDVVVAIAAIPASVMHHERHPGLSAG